MSFCSACTRSAVASPRLFGGLSLDLRAGGLQPGQALFAPVQLGGQVGVGLPALAAVFPELGPGPAGSPPSEAAALESVVGLWRSHAPLVLLLDDLHWADPATLAALAYLHRRSAVLPGAVIATVGAEKALTSHQLHRLPASARISLPPLSSEELAEAGLYST
jgi:hypothetical protein